MSVSNAPVALASASFTDFPNAEIVTGGTGISVVPGGSQGNLTISVTGQLTSLANLAATGFVVFNDSTNTYTARTINSGAGISVTRGDGLSGNCVIAQEAASVVQRVYVTGPLGTPGSFPNIEFIAGDGISVAVADSGLGAKAQVTITNTHGSEGSVDSVDAASTTGMLITGTPGLPITESGTINIDLPGTGVDSAVVQGDMLIGSTGGSYTVVGIGTTGKLWTSNGTTASWQSPATSGTVTSVGISSATGLVVGSSPVTTSGTMTVNLPGTGASSAVVQGDMLVGNTGGSYTTVAIGTTGKLWTSDGTTASWQSPATSGTVTSVGLSSSDAFISVAGSPVTTSGTLAMTINTLGIDKGGTGQITASAAFNAISPVTSVGDLMIGTGVNTVSRLAIGSNNTYLKSNGTTASWVALSVPTITVGTQAGILNETPVNVTCPQVTGGSTILLSFAYSTWSAGNLTPGVELVGISAGSLFQIRCFNVGGVNMASSVDVMWTVIN